jgi:hypothetical protein
VVAQSRGANRVALVFGTTLTARTNGPEWGVSRRQLLQQSLRLLQIARVKTFREPAVNRSQQFARLAYLALVAPEACEAHGGAEFPRFGLLLAGDCEGALEVRFRFHVIVLRRHQRDLARNAIDLSLEPPLLGFLGRYARFVDAAPSLIELAKVSVRGCEI